MPWGSDQERPPDSRASIGGFKRTSRTATRVLSVTYSCMRGPHSPRRWPGQHESPTTNTIGRSTT